MSAETLEVTELGPQIRNSGFCAVAEVTNGISNRRLKRDQNRSRKRAKSAQVTHARDFLYGLGGAKVEVYAGLIFFRNKNVKRFKGLGLDFVSQIKRFGLAMTQEALLAANDQLDYDKDLEVIAELLHSVRSGIGLEKILYLDSKQWDRFKDTDLARGQTREQYHDRIATAKAVFLEQYAGLAAKATALDAIVHTSYQYSHDGEADLIVIGDKPTVIRALSHGDYFVKHPT